MFNPQKSEMFTLWKDPVSGVESRVLTKRVAPFQQSFYYTNPSFSDDGRFLWFYTASPPQEICIMEGSWQWLTLKTALSDIFQKQRFQ